MRVTSGPPENVRLRDCRVFEALRRVGSLAAASASCHYRRVRQIALLDQAQCGRSLEA